MSAATNPPTLVPRVAAILRAVARSEPDGASTSGLARDTLLARPTVHRLLTSLADEGLIDRDVDTGRWLLGPESYLLGTAASTRFDISRHARAVVDQLAAATGESAFLSICRGNETVCLLRKDGSFPLRSHVLYEGIRFPLGVASAGLVILSHLPEHELEAYVRQTHLEADWGPAHAEQPLRARIAATRAVGYAVNPGLIVEGSWGMAAAVFNQDGRPQWALSLTGVQTRFAPERITSLGRLLLEQAHVLSARLSR